MSKRLTRHGMLGFTHVGLPAVRKVKRAAFTLVELLVVVGIIAILVALLLPSLQKARIAAKRVQCLSNMRQTLTATMAYAAQFNDYPYNWNPFVSHSNPKPRLSNDYMRIYNVHPPTTGALVEDAELWNEGHHLTPWWTYYLIQYRFIKDARALGCSFGADAPWEHWPYRFYGAGGLPPQMLDIGFLREYPTYIYRGASDVDDLRMNAYNCGRIAYANPQDPKFAGRTGAWFPHANTKKPAPLFHCPLLVDYTPEGWIISGAERYMAAHAGMKSIRQRTGFPMNAAGNGGRDGHYLATTIGWTDGSAQYYEQPPGNGIWYVNYQGQITQSPEARY